MKKFILLSFLSIVVIFSSYGQDRNNEYEVIQLGQNTHRQSVWGDVIVKFADRETLNFGVSSRGMPKTGINSVDSLLNLYTIKSIDRICPFEKNKTEIKSSKAYNGTDVKDFDLSRLCLIKIEDTISTDNLIKALNSLDEVEFAEPNYIVYALGVPSKDEVFKQAVQYPQPEQINDDSTFFDAEAYTSEPMYSLQWGIPAVGLDLLWAADTNSSTERPIIAILDTGVDTDTLI